MMKNKNPAASLPATNVGDIPAGREGFIQKVMDEVEGPHPYPRRSEICSMFENAMRLHWPTPADPGSQVEAVDFTEWWINEGWQIRKNGTFIQIGASGTPMLGRPDDRMKSVDELFTLYKQSL